MTRPVRTLRAAGEEFAAAVRWYEQQRTGLGAEFFTAVSDTTAPIQDHPEIGAPVSEDQRTRRVLLPRFPYQRVYRLMADEVVIVAVAHSRRQPGYWRDRG